MSICRYYLWKPRWGQPLFAPNILGLSIPMKLAILVRPIIERSLTFLPTG